MAKPLIGLLIVVAAALGIYAVSNQDDGTMMEDANMMKDEAMMQKDETMMKDGSNMMQDDTKMMDDTTMMKGETMMEDGGAMMDGGDAMMSKGSYEAYAPEKLARANDGDVVLFFRADWCPTCRAADSDIKANLGSIPGGLTILDVNYDTATALKQKYGVTYQHTFVQVDSAGNQIAKWSGSATLADIVARVQ